MTKTSTQAYQQSLKPEDVIALLKAGNQRFVENNQTTRDLKEQINVTASGQYPFATILSCIDSRAPAEFIFDQGIGDVFNVRIAGNIINEDILGSMEFSCKVAGSKLILVLGHTDCGAIKGACNEVELGNLTGLVQKIVPAVDSEQQHTEDRTGNNIDFVNDVAKLNVQNSVAEIANKSDILSEMKAAGEIMIVGALYDVATGMVHFFD